MPALKAASACRGDTPCAGQLPANRHELTRQQIDLRHHRADLPGRGGQAGGVFVVQLLPGRRLDRDVALVPVEDRQFQRDLRAKVADVGVVAAAGHAEHQVGEARQDRGPQLGILRAVTKLQRHQVGTPLAPASAAPAPRHPRSTAGCPASGPAAADIGRETQQRIELVAAGKLLALLVIDLGGGGLQGGKIGR